MVDPAPYADPILERKRALARTRYGLDTAQYNWQRGNIHAQQATDTAALSQRFGQMRDNLPGQYQGRGLLNSGIYARGLFDFNQDKANQFAKLSQTHGQQYQNNSYGAQQAGQTQAESFADIDAQEASARAALAAQLKGLS